MVTSTRKLIHLDDTLLLSTPEASRPEAHREAVLAICSDVLVIGLKLPKDESLYFDWRLEGQRIIKLSRCQVSLGQSGSALQGDVELGPSEGARRARPLRPFY